MTRFLSIVLATALIATATTPALAELSKDPATQPAGIYELDPTHASVTWKINHLGLSYYTARFDKINATLNFDPANLPASSVKATVDIASVNTGYDVMDKKLQGEQFFDISKGATINFNSTTLTKVTENTGKMAGTLTMRGVTKPVTFDVTFNGGMFNKYANAQALGFSARTMIKRSEFGMAYLVPDVSDNVEIIIEAEFVKKPDADQGTQKQ